MAERRFWLVKSEPSSYSFTDLMNEPDGTAEWDGVRNFTARNHLRDGMKVGDGVLFYHSGTNPLSIVGAAVVAREGYPDHTSWDASSSTYDPQSTPEKPRWYMVDLRAEREFPQPVTVERMRATPELVEMMVLSRRGARLSVQPVTAREWETVLRLAGAG